MRGIVNSVAVVDSGSARGHFAERVYGDASDGVVESDGDDVLERLYRRPRDGMRESPAHEERKDRACCGRHQAHDRFHSHVPVT